MTRPHDLSPNKPLSRIQRIGILTGALVLMVGIFALIGLVIANIVFISATGSGTGMGDSPGFWGLGIGAALGLLITVVGAVSLRPRD